MNTGNSTRNDSDDSLALLGWMLHAGGLAVSLVICALLFGGIVRPLIQEGRDVGRQIYSAEMYISAASAIESRHRLAISALDEEQRLAEERAARIPDTARESELLAQLTDLARRSGMEILAYQPAGSFRAGSIHALSIDINGQGSYAATCTFLAGLESLPRLCHLTRLNIIAPAVVGGDLHVDLTLQVYYGAKPIAPELLANQPLAATASGNPKSSPARRHSERISTRAFPEGRRPQ